MKLNIIETLLANLDSYTMKHHTRIYMNYFGYGEGEFIPCELTGLKAADIHHINPRQMGGVEDDRLDVPENLFACTRRIHDLAEANKIPKGLILNAHQSFMEAHRRNTELALKLHYAKTESMLKAIGLNRKDLE